MSGPDEAGQPTYPAPGGSGYGYQTPPPGYPAASSGYPPPAQPGYPPGYPPPAPPGQPPAAYGYGYGYGYPYPQYPVAAATSPVRGLGTAIQILLVIQGLAAIGLLFPVLHERNLIDRIRSGSGTVTLHEAQRADDTVAAVGGIVALLYLATGVVWIIWFYRARRNVEAWSPIFQRFSPGWAIGSWFIPVANFFIPFLIAQDVLDDTERAPEDRVRKRRFRPLWLAWWITYVGLPAIALIERFKDTNTVDQIADLNTIQIVGVVVRIVSVGFAFAIVRELTTAQTARMRQGPAGFAAAGQHRG